MESHSDQNVGLVHFIALILCLENSFWLKSPATLFIEDFVQAHQLYTTTGTKERVENALQQLGIPSGRKEFRVALTRILLDHRISCRSTSDSSHLQHPSLKERAQKVFRRLTK
ncbi:hypothetical protein E4T56_gene14534 [Termitomyces sp. T112]|nr:hypothetical protein E4T56_gene14534 [Termitomyces sp. T112]